MANLESDTSVDLYLENHQLWHPPETLSIYGGVVIGLASPEGVVFQAGYGRAEVASTRSVSLPKPVAHNLLTFYEEYFAAPEDPSAREDPPAPYDCHSAAQFIVGHADQIKPIDMRNHAPATHKGRLHPGEMYLMGKAPDRHSVIGTSDPRFCLGAWGPNGPLVLAHTLDVKKLFRAGEVLAMRRRDPQER